MRPRCARGVRADVEFRRSVPDDGEMSTDLLDRLGRA
jgi:hypothetical protein